MAKQNNIYSVAKPAFDVYAPFLPVVYEGVPAKRNIWRVGNTVIVRLNREWKRYGIDTPEAKVWKRIIGASAWSYQYWTNRLVEHLQAKLEAKKIVTLVQPAKVDKAA